MIENTKLLEQIKTYGSYIVRIQIIKYVNYISFSELAAF